MTKPLQDIITEIRDIRTAEVAKRRYSGPQGKIASIALYLGNPITEHTYELPMFQEELVPGVITPIDHDINDIGYFFSTTSRSHGLEITVDGYMEGKSLVANEIVVTWNCDVVFREEYNQLMAYVPGDWENTIEHLWKSVEKKMNNESDVRVNQEKREAEGLHRQFLEWLKSTWGV